MINEAAGRLLRKLLRSKGGGQIIFDEPVKSLDLDQVTGVRN
ncbi:hypothetical protein OH492_09690 [Vibrio chagasii]|nr:hypothetical protein [Vibrio chagasii]